MKNLSFALLSLLLVLVVGSVGYKFIGGEAWSWLDAIYFTIITITTTGYGEIHPLSDDGRVFTILVSLAGIGVFLYVLGAVTQFIVAGELKEFLGRRKMTRELNSLKDHYILCGFGRMGKEVATELKNLGLPFVIIEKKELALSEAQKAGYLFLAGDATRDEVLKEAGIERAKGLFAMLSDDAENIFVTLSAKELNYHLSIIARSNMPETDSKLLRAGATRVVSPFAIGGRRMVFAGLKPTVVDFLDVVMHDKNLDLFLEEILIMSGSRWIGKKVQDLQLELGGEGVILSVCRAENNVKRFISSGIQHHVLAPSDHLVVIGTSQQLQRIEALVRERAT